MKGYEMKEVKIFGICHNFDCGVKERILQMKPDVVCIESNKGNYPFFYNKYLWWLCRKICGVGYNMHSAMEAVDELDIPACAIDVTSFNLSSFIYRNFYGKIMYCVHRNEYNNVLNNFMNLSYEEMREVMRKRNGNKGLSSIDFRDKYMADNIITNPPYKIALDFVLRAKQQSKKKIAMFLKTVFLESEKRYEMFQDKEFPLKVVYQFCKRVSLYKGGVKMKNSGMIAYAWYVWDKNYKGEPIIKWIKNKKKEK